MYVYVYMYIYMPIVIDNVLSNIVVVLPSIETERYKDGYIPRDYIHSV